MRSYPYSGMSYANPHAVTQIANGVSTSTFSYDQNGNLTQKTNDGVTTTYLWDYANRLTALGVGGATSTYGYDAFGTRVYQISASTSAATTTYPFKFFSIASTTKSSTNFATSTEYLFNGDTLVATVEQKFRNGSATGTAQTRYIHPDHLGSTNVVTNASGTVVQTLDFYPYGATRINSSVGGADSARKYIGQFVDSSGLDYLNARYYESARGQFISQDPVFWEIGLTQDGKNALSNPQALNSYGYASDNPITNKDPSGRVGYDTAIDFAAEYGPSVGPTLSSWASSIGSIIGAGAAAIYNSTRYNDGGQKAQNYNNNRSGNSRYVPFSQQGREVQPSGPPDPYNPWDGWKPGNPKDWKTWVGTGVGIIGAATDIYQQAQDLPSNNRLPSGKWTPLPPINQGGTYRSWSPQQSSGSQSRNSASFNAQVSAIQAQINQIQAQINAIVQSRSGVSR